MHPFLIYTSPIIKRLIQVTVSFTLGCIIFESLLSLPLQELFSLNSAAITHHLYWQPITSLFLIPSPTLSFSFLLDLSFTMLLLWMLGSQVFEFLGKRRFLFIYFGSALVGSLSALLAIYFTHQTALISTCPAALLAIATIWTMCVPSQNVLVFFFIPIPAKWFLAIAFLGTIVSSGIQKDYVHFAAYSGAFAFTYLVGIMKWQLRGPFTSLFRIEATLKKISHTASIFWQWKVMSFFRARRTCTKEREELFIDQALTKISQSGKVSLTPMESLRLKWISFKKRIGT